MAGLLIFNKLDFNSKMLILLLACATPPNLSKYIFSDEKHRWIVYNINTLVDSAIWGFIFLRSSRSKKIKILTVFLLCVQAIAFIWTCLFFGIASRFYNEFVCWDSLLQIFWVLSYFYEKYKYNAVSAFEREPLFWFCLGILIYAPTTYFHFAYFKIIRVDKSPEVANLWNLHSLLNGLMYMIFFIGIIVNRKRASRYEVRAM